MLCFALFKNIGRKMTVSEFIENLVDLNDGGNFPKELLKNIYQSISNEPIECDAWVVCGGYFIVQRKMGCYRTEIKWIKAFHIFILVGIRNYSPTSCVIKPNSHWWFLAEKSARNHGGGKNQDRMISRREIIWDRLHRREIIWSEKS